MSDGFTDIETSTRAIERENEQLACVSAHIIAGRIEAISLEDFCKEWPFSGDSKETWETLAEKLANLDENAWARFLTLLYKRRYREQIREIKELSPFSDKTLLWAYHTGYSQQEQACAICLGDFHALSKSIVQSQGLTWGEGNSYMIALSSLTTGKAYLISS